MTSVEEVPEYAAEHIRRRLAADPRTNELEVKVSVVAGDKVFLHGVTSSEDRREAIGIVAAEVLPGYDIHNEVSVAALGHSSEPEEVR